MGVDPIQCSIGECAREVLEVVPLTMRVIRGQLRRYGTKEVSVAHFRTLAYLNRHEGASLSEVAEHIGLSMSSMSELIDDIVTRGLVNRQTQPQDRRRITLTLTDHGSTTLRKAREATASYLERKLSHLSAPERASVFGGMQILKSVFTETIDQPLLSDAHPLPTRGSYRINSRNKRGHHAV
jgi:DNA-binding MarR family transcriptional regulator